MELHHSGRVDEFWKRWYFWGSGPRSESVMKKAGMNRGHFSSVMAYFNPGITSAMAEYTKSKIDTVQEMPMDKATKII